MTGLPQSREVKPLQRGIILDVIGCGRVSLLPNDLPRVHVISRNAVVRRLDQRQAIYRQVAHPHAILRRQVGMDIVKGALGVVGIGNDAADAQRIGLGIGIDGIGLR